MIIRTMIFPLTLSLTASAQAVCTPDTLEIGDTGPGSSRVCQMLEKRFLNAHAEILAREIRTPDHVSVMVSVDGQAQSFDFHLVGANWIIAAPQLVHSPQ